MSTQKAKFELFARLQALGFTYEEAHALRRIEMTLHRWAELECGDGNDYASWAIERDEKTDKPYMVTHYHAAPFTDPKHSIRRHPIADREKGALKRLAAILDARNLRESPPSLEDYRDVLAYHQTDPRGCALYLVKRSDIPAGASLSSCYTNGLAVTA